MKYRKKKLNNIRFPVGGIGTGSVSLAGNGALVDWEIFNRPNKGSLNGYSHFAIRAQLPDGKIITKVLQGDHTNDLTGQYVTQNNFAGYGYGPFFQTMAGFPHFKNVCFEGAFPIAKITFTDNNFPAKVTLTAFNPFIPLDADASGIPAAFFQINIKSYLDNVKYTVVLSVRNPFEDTVNVKLSHSKYTAVQLKNASKNDSDKDYGDLTVAVDHKNSLYQQYWYRGSWRDPISTYWHDLTHGKLADYTYKTPGKADTCCVGAEDVIDAGKSKSFRFVLSWNVPNNYNYWEPCKDESGNDVLWKNYYATQYADSTASCFYALDNWDTLYKKTNRFCKSLHSSTLDSAVIDAVSSTLSVLKSSTVLRLEDGSFYGWEGVAEHEGSCQGTCTHVWSYAYALCFLFPELEQSVRDLEFRYSTDDDGRMYFRTALPLGNGHVVQAPCVDGQMATVIKIYREWKLTGNSQWLRDNWSNIQKVLEYAWSDKNTYEWDKDKDGVLEGRQHHTLDLELFGPSGWLQGMYLCALKAAAEMADFLGKADKKAEYEALFEKGRQWTKEHLFNGQYFYHKVDLKNKGYVEHFDCPQYWNGNKGELKYQIGDGCEIDQLLGQWHANICGLGDIFDKEQRKTALKSIFFNNFKPSLREFANMWRIFALNDEGGTIICDYPEHCYKPAIPISYCDECMTGFEYALAGLLISEGFTQEGLQIIKAVRNRYDGEKRNPWNEIECGSHYARPMSSFALLPIFSGFTFDVPNNHIGFAPRIPGDFKCFWSVGTGWGDFIKTSTDCKIILAQGTLTLESIYLEKLDRVQCLRIDGRPIPFTKCGSKIYYDK